MINNCKNDGGKIPSFGGANKRNLFNLDLEDLLDDECEQIILSPELFNAFITSSKNRKNFNKDDIRKLFKYVIYLYNDTIQTTEMYGNLTYLKKISNLLDYLGTSNIMELSIDQLNILLDMSDGESIKKAYRTIKKNRHNLTEREFKLFNDMLKNTKSEKIDTKEAKNVYNYLLTLYNNNTILQDNINYIDYLETFSKLSMKAILSMRMCDILEIFNIHNINYENINEEKKLINDLTVTNIGLNTL